jgi:hypothetical protein
LLTAEAQRSGEKEAESQIFSPPQRLCGEKETISVKVATQVIQDGRQKTAIRQV